ncbi:hypothetical protein ILUMI_11031 [Ignelater luminosus]|uniref:C2H2-type domain-containing protein n=1 Tax=Ignelater luminosus TaxID=2038154 RepID=A0A8K0CZ85_IGNLU|nr:hypothetical protein ILUMI_11031 [Ignelater luminosus]
MGKQDEDWKNLREAWNKVDKSHNSYSRLLTWWSENKHDQKIVLEKITALKNQSNCPTSMQKWIFKSATTSTKTTATSEPARSSQTVATTQPQTSSTNVEQEKEIEVEELPSKPPTSANTPVQNRLKSEIAELTFKIEKLQDFVSTGFQKDDQKHELHQDRLKLKELTQKLNRAENLRKAQQKSRENKKLEAPQTLPKPATIRERARRSSGSDLEPGPQAVNVLSVDDKARVPLGLPVAQKQAPILMRYERQILMPDHDYLIAKGLKLIPPVIDVLCFKDWKVSYSGPTCISIRGGAIDSSTAETHRQDLIKYLHRDKMRDYFRSNNRIKPVLVVFSDGGPDEAPRNEKVLQAAVKSFKMLDLDSMFVCTDAPHQSARNPVERRMTPLSRDLCGLIITHDVCGTHLDARGRTIDKVLEKKNFEAAGRILAEVWDRTVIDGFEVTAQYVPPASTASSESTEANDVLWRDRHILQSKYCLQVVKCQDESCCSPMIFRLRLYLEDGFLPAPVMFRHGLYGLEACSQENMDGRFLDISQRLQNASSVPVKPCPNDYYCSSVIPELQKLICPVCKKYFFRKASLTKHGKIHKNLATIFELAEEEIETEVVSSIDEGGVQIIEDMEARMQPIYEDDTGN